MNNLYSQAGAAWPQDFETATVSSQVFLSFRIAWVLLLRERIKGQGNNSLVGVGNAHELYCPNWGSLTPSFSIFPFRLGATNME